MGASPLDWRSDFGAASRFDTVQRLQLAIQESGETSKAQAQKAAFAAETEAYSKSQSRDAYDALCNSLISAYIAKQSLPQPKLLIDQSVEYGLSFGKYQDCNYIASGLISEVYRSGQLALKIITETRDVEPHNPAREVKVLRELSHARIIQLIETSKDEVGRLILVFPYMPLTLASVLDSGAVNISHVRSYFGDIFSALAYVHSLDIIHRDIKPSNILLASVSGPAYLADFGTAWHPHLSKTDEPADHKVLEVGTTCYRAPETLFGNRSYGTSLDIWAAGTMLAECSQIPPSPLFESRGSSEDGNQLGLILSIFKTLGTPTKESWPEATHFSTPPFEWYQDFPGKSWEILLPDAPDDLRSVVSKMLYYESGKRLTASSAHRLLTESRT